VTPRLEAVAGAQPGRSWDLGGSCVVGRAPGCEIRIEDASVSREHARLSEEEGRWVLVDLASRNGTFVNGRRVTRAPLAPGDEIGLGRVRVRFTLPSPPPPPVLDEEITLEGESEPALSAPVAPARIPPPAAEPRTVAPPSPPPPPSAPSPLAAARLALGVRRLEGTGTLLVRATGPPGSGWLRQDLGQRGVLFRIGLLLALFAVAVGVFFAARALTGFLLVPEENAAALEDGR